MNGYQKVIQLTTITLLLGGGAPKPPYEGEGKPEKNKVE